MFLGHAAFLNTCMFISNIYEENTVTKRLVNNNTVY